MGRLESVQDVCYQTDQHFYSNLYSNVCEHIQMFKTTRAKRQMTVSILP